MVIEMKGSLLQQAPRGSLIGVPVNTCGVAGKGMAKYMKLRWPLAYEFYVKECKRGRMRTGILKCYSTDDFLIAFIPTKIHWSNPSTTDLVEASLVRLKEFMIDGDIDTCWLPALGCGHNTGQLDYETAVKPLVYKHFKDSEKVINLFKPMVV